MSNRLAILVEGIDDPSLVTEIEQTIRDSFAKMALPGSWRVTARPSRVKGRWDFSVHGLDVQHNLSIAVHPSLLPKVIPIDLEQSLNVCSFARLKTIRAERAISHTV